MLETLFDLCSAKDTHCKDFSDFKLRLYNYVTFKKP